MKTLSESRRHRGFPALAVVLFLAVPPAAGAFEAPPARELEKVTWVQRPCADLLQQLREAVEGSGPAISDEKALSLENTSPEANRKILRALGRGPRSESEVDWDATFNRYIGADPRTLNPLFFSSRYDFWVGDLLFFSPIGIDWDFRCQGDRNIITSWETSKDHLLDRIVLRRDLRWSDGRPVTAEDVEFTWKLLADEKIPSRARSSIVDGLEAVKAYDKWTVVYFQKEPLATNWLHISFPIVPRHVFAKALRADPTLRDCPLNKTPVTCGPYRLVHWRPGEELLFERDDDWFLDRDGKKVRAKPYFRRVRFRVLPNSNTRFLAFKVGDTDDTQLDSNQWVRQWDASIHRKAVKVRGDEWTYAFIGWNACSQPPNPFFGDRRVRQAMTFSLDHDYMLQEMFYGIYRAGEGIFHPDSWMAARGLKPFHRDLDRAEQLLDAAGWKDSDGDGVRDKRIDGKLVPFRFTLSCPKAGSGPRVAEQLQADLKTVGVDCRVALMEWVAFQKAVSGHGVQAFLMSMGTGADPDTARNLWHSDAIKTGRNHVGYSNPEVDRLLEEGRREHSLERRAAIYAQADRLIYEDQPITILLYQPTLWAFSRTLRGYHTSPKGFYGFAPGFRAVWKKRVVDSEGGSTSSRKP